MINYFDPSLTTQSIVYEIWLFIFLIWIFVYWIKNYRFFVWRFIALVFWVFFFELLTSSFWQIEHLWKYSYINWDVSIIMTLSWVSLIFFARFIYDVYVKKQNIFKEILSVVILASIFWLINLILLKSLWIFSYSTLTQELVLNWITVFNRPLEAIIYFPVFIFISYSFFKYFEIAIYNKYIFDNYKINFKKDIFITIINILLIWYLLHPMMIFSQNIYFILLIICVIFWLFLTNIIISKSKKMPLFIKFLWAGSLFSMYLSVIISYFLWKDLLKFHEITKNTYTSLTFTMPNLNFTDAEFVWIFIFSYLLIATTKFIKIITDNKNLELDDWNMTFRWWKSLFNK